MFGFRSNAKVPAAAADALDGHFNEHELKTMSRLGTLIDLDAGATLTVEGQIGREALILTEGTAAVSRGDEVIATIGVGAVIGEGSLLLDQPRNATVVATSKVTAFVFNPQEFRSLVHQCPRFAQQVAQLAADRIPA